MADNESNPQHPTPNTKFVLNLFGAFESYVDGKPLPSLRAVKGKHLLGLLALRAGQEVSRQWLAETLWPDSETPSDSLRQSLSDLRQKMGEQAFRLESPVKSTLRLNCENAAVDVIAFDKAVKRDDAEELRHAIGLYRGDLLEGVGEVWVLAERETRRQAYLKGLETLAAQSRIDGDTQAEIAYLRRTLASDPCRETAARNVMIALEKAGEPQAALDVYYQLRQRLQDDGNAIPESETRALYQRILNRDKGVAKNGKSGKPSALKDNSTPAPEWLARSSSLEEGGNVPLALTPLIGREMLLREIETRVLTHPLVTLAGTGGVGKTRLATQAARELKASFDDGVWFVDLSAAVSPSQVAQEIARVFGIRTETGNDVGEIIANVLRPRHLLIALDNCETCLQAVAGMAQELLRACPHLRLLATSRERLGLTGESVVAVKPLETPTISNSPQPPAPSPKKAWEKGRQSFSGSKANEVLEVSSQRAETNLLKLLDVPSVRLFVERAQATRDDFAVTADNAPYVAEICRRLDGLPLALELAGPLLELLTPQEIAAKLNQRFALLTEEGKLRPTRHQSLHAVIASSVDLLPEVERILLRRLSVFVGGWTLDAAEAIAKDEAGRMKDEERKQETGNRGQHSPTPNTQHPTPVSSFASLRSLVAKSLVVAEEWNGQMRFRLLESIREFAAEMLIEAGEAANLRVRHLDWMLHTARQAAPELTGGRQAAWLERLEVETGNLRRALDWAEHDSPGRQQGLALANALGRYWQIRGHFAEGRERLSRLLDAPETQKPTVLRANALNWLALLSVFVGDLEGAETACRAGLTLWEQQGESRGAAGSLGILGIIAANRGDYASAEKWYRQALEGARGVGDQHGEAGTLGYLGINAVNQGYYEEARQCYEASLQLRRALNDVWGIAACLNNLGQLARKNGEPQRARELLSESLILRRELRDRRNVGITLNVLALLAWEQNDLPEASACLLEATDLFDQLGDRRSLAYALEAWARIAVKTSEPERALRLYEAAKLLRERVGSPLPPAEQTELERCFLPAPPTLRDENEMPRNHQEPWTLEHALSEARAIGIERKFASR